MNKQSHWNNIYTNKPATGVSWFREHLDSSLDLIESAKVGPDASIIDVGGGASTLVDDLLKRGYRNITVLDISESALDRITTRLEDAPAGVR